MMKQADSYDENEKDEEEVPLYRGRLFKSNTADEVKRRRSIRGLLVILVILLGVAWVVVDDKEAVHTEDGVIAKEKKKPKTSAKGFCPQFCAARLNQRMKHHGGDFLKQSDLMRNIDSAKGKLVADLKVKYGEYFDKMFIKDGELRKGFSGLNHNDISTSRFRRKLKMKLLQMQVAIHWENENLEGCNCNEQPAQGRRSLAAKTVVLPELRQTFSQFVWATGGHSAAAGHGNLHNETYTAFMEAAAQPIFEAVGIEFEGRNYAMGGMRSAPEFALCQESIFGTDADLVTWDFGMTDVPQNWKQELYVSRAAVHRNRPAVVAINIHGFDSNGRKDILQKVEDFGVTTFYLVEEAITSMQDALPDMLGMNQEQIDAVPEFVRYFKCKDQLEKSDPGCDTFKYSDAKFCPNRLQKAAWHPGWKVNALYGNLMAFHLIDNLKGAIEELGSEEYDPAVKLDELRNEEDEDYRRLHSEFTVSMEAPSDFLEGDVLAAIDPNWLHFGPLICHTALAPAQLRYKGIFTETDETGMFGYYKGISKSAADKGQSEGPMRIVYEENFRDNPCEYLTKIDMKDFLYSHEKDGWTNVKIPNDSEVREYGALEKPKGIVMVCFIMCDWGQCPDGDMRPEHLKEGKLQMKVNGEQVTELTTTSDCNIARHKDGFFFKDDDGRFNIEVFVEKSTTDHRQYTRITTIVVL